VMDHIKDQGYYQGEITPVGPDIDFEAPHDRDRLPGESPEPSVKL
jgi:putative glutathione S-transferase